MSLPRTTQAFERIMGFLEDWHKEQEDSSYGAIAAYHCARDIGVDVDKVLKPYLSRMFQHNVYRIMNYDSTKKQTERVAITFVDSMTREGAEEDKQEGMHALVQRIGSALEEDGASQQAIDTYHRYFPEIEF